MEQIGKGNVADDVFELVAALFRFRDDLLNVFLVIDGQDAAESVGAEVLDEGASDFIPVIQQEFLELSRSGEGSSVRHFS